MDLKKKENIIFKRHVIMPLAVTCVNENENIRTTNDILILFWSFWVGGRLGGQRGKKEVGRVGREGSGK